VAVRLVQQVLSAEASVALDHLDGAALSEDDWARLARTMGEIAEAPLVIAEATGTPDVIAAAAQALTTRPLARLLVVDAVGEDIPASLAALRALATTTGVWVLALVGPEPGRQPGELDERDADDADLHLRIHRDVLHGPQGDQAGQADLVITRNRYGPAARVPVTFQGQYSRFVDC